MQASPKVHLKTLLSPLAVALVLAAPHALAKKDLFANDPGAKQSQHVEQLVPNASSSSVAAETVKTETPAEPIKADDKTQATDAETKAKSKKEPDDSPSYLEKQLERLKGHLVEAKEDLFGSKKSTKKEALTVPADAAATDGAHASEEVQPEIPTISATEAAQRAQALAEGQVINVRKYQEEDKPRYAVKLLQKNGRMKTINLDAVSGALIEDSPQ